MKTINKTELLGCLEEAYSDDLQAADLKSQAKAFTDSKSARLKDFAKEVEVEPKLINKAYARYKEIKNGTLDPADEDFYNLMAAVDESFAEEEAQS